MWKQLFSLNENGMKITRKNNIPEYQLRIIIFTYNLLTLDFLMFALL